MSAKEINLKIDELSKEYIKLLKGAKNYDEKRKMFELYYKTLLTFEKMKYKEVYKSD